MPLIIQLGSTVAIGFDGDAAVLDPTAMAGTAGAPADAGRRSQKVPEQGIDDTSLVPPYARWFVMPGAEVPIATDPKDATRAQIDWAQLAEHRATAGGRWREAPPEGSSATAQLTMAPPAESAMATWDGFDLTMSRESAAAIEGITVERCAGIEAVPTKRRLLPKDRDAVAASDCGVRFGR